MGDRDVRAGLALCALCMLVLALIGCSLIIIKNGDEASEREVGECASGDAGVGKTDAETRRVDF
ncbi:MAG: hypothetical protein EKK55_19310 [Rhodocyclaceae bacterium]|nr:MAG: hypothetical protein EKK55_19310 [Rhodocyclaceae bacterium]